MVNTSFQVNQTSLSSDPSHWLFHGQIVFDFQWQYAYNVSEGQFVDSMVKFSFILLIVMLSTKAGRLLVRRRFHLELCEAILKAGGEAK